MRAQSLTVTLAGKKRIYQTAFSNRKGEPARSRSEANSDYEQAYKQLQA